MGSLPVSVAEIVPDAIYAVGGGVDERVPVSWIPSCGAGWMPVQCYVFRCGAEAMVLDGGLGAHRVEIEAGLTRVLAGAGAPRLLISRWEPDAMVNLPWLIDRFGATKVLSSGGIDPLDFFVGFDAAASRCVAEAAAGPARLVPISPGEVLKVGPLRIEVVATSLRLLSTIWFYERTTRSLFTADSFGLLANPSGPWPFVARPSQGALATDVLRRSLIVKFDWLAGACCKELVADLVALKQRFEINRVCPTFGATIEGPVAVATLIESAGAALELLSHAPRVGALHGFDWQHALSPEAVVDPPRVR